MGLFSSTSKVGLPWTSIESVEQLHEVLEEHNPILLFKHSTRCSISIMMKSSFERSWDTGSDVKLYFIDLLRHRDVSNKVEELTGVQHQSPQVIVLKEKKVVYAASHSSINTREILKSLK